MKWLIALLLMLSGCGYKVLRWDSGSGQTLYIAPVQASKSTALLSTRFRDALRQQCLLKSDLEPVNHEPSHFKLIARLDSYDEAVVATDVDGRTRRIQFSIRASFELVDQAGTLLWSLPSYQYADQFDLTTTDSIYRDEAHLVQDEALRDVADLVMTNMVLALMDHSP